MKKLFGSFSISLIFIFASYAQTVDEILAEYFNAIGQEKLLATNTIMMKGKIIHHKWKFLLLLCRKDQCISDQKLNSRG